MPFLDNIRVRLWNRKIKALVRHSKRERAMVGLDKAKNVGIYYFQENEAQYNSVKALVDELTGRNISVVVLAYCPDKVKPAYIWENPHFGMFSKTDLGFDNVPHNHFVDIFVNQKFDILFDLSVVDHYQNVYVSTRSRAKFKIGHSNFNNYNIFDLIVSTNEKVSLDEHIKDVLHYLNNFNSVSK